MGHYLFNFTKRGAAKGRSLREQAADLLEVKLWGIGPKTPHRGALAPGDRVLIYVGAPESAFIGHAELASPNHTWTPDEQVRYPRESGWDSGVAFRWAELWRHPLPIKAILPSLELRETNPNAHFFAGVVRIKRADYETVVAAAQAPGDRAGTDRAASSTASKASSERRKLGSKVDVELLFETVEKLDKAASLNFSEYDTRAMLIDKYLAALGYTELGDIQHGSPVDSGTFPDYVLRVNGSPAIVIEAKKLGAPLGAKEAAQVVGYCANLGVRWGALTDGRHFKLYDAPLLGVKPEQRLVLSVDLGDYKNREDFEARVYPELELIAKGALETGGGLERRAAQEAVRELLTSADSKTVQALRRELGEKKNVKVTQGDLIDLVSELLS